MLKTPTFAAIALTITAITPALADDDGTCARTAGHWMARDAIRDKATAMGYDVRRIKSEGSCYEVYAIDGNGSRVELLLDPVTGDVVRRGGRS